METELPDHEKVRFRRDEIASLESFPSACSSASRPLPKRFRTRLLGWAATGLIAILVLFLSAGGLFFVVGVDAIGNERLRLQAEQAITRLAGFDLDVTLGELHLGFGRSSLLALEVRDARIAAAEGAASIATAGTLRFGLKMMPLLRGKVELGRVTLADAEISPAELPIPGMGALAVPTIGPEAVREAIFSAVHRAFEMTGTSGLRRVSLSNISLRMGRQAVPAFVIETLELLRVGDTEIGVEGVGHYRGRAVSFGGRAERDPSTGNIEGLAIDIASPEANVLPSVRQGGLRSLGAARLSLSGHEKTDSDEQGFLSLDIVADDILIGVDDDELLIDRAAIRTAFGEGDEVFSVLASRLEVGRTAVNFQGTVGPLARAGGEPAYAFDLVSRDSILAPADSSESALPFAVHLAGRYEPSSSRLTAQRINVRTSEGEMTASAAMVLPGGMSPGITLAIYVPEMPTAHAKQFWPWFAARGARKWTLENVFGGYVRESNLRFNVPPGRLGNGVPLSQQEVVGRFALEDTRFDIAGNIPPVRDGTGWVEFRGTDVSVGLSAGTIYMPSGRSVAASKGSLVIDAAHLTPRIGKLEIDIKGEAPAIAELASYEPIDATRFHELKPADLSGDMAGHITADIPLQAGIPAADLAWRVALDYENLSIAKPFEGQKVTKANGSLLVQPDRAEFSAEAELNAVPAQLRIVEPLGGSKVERVRNVELQVDDASRERLFPGLGVLVSGPFKVIYDEQPDRRKALSVSLDSARLTVPWIGWQKGAGIPATATFFMEQDGETVELSEFVLSGGGGIAVSGRILLSGGSLQEAQLDKVRLNPADDYSATIRHTDTGYSVSVKGRAFDARSVIKKALGDDPASARGGGSADTDIVLKASLSTVHGFNDESLEQVELTYSARGAQPEQLSVRAAASGHGSVQLAKGAEQGKRVVRVSSSNAGAMLRFLDIYKHVRGGQLSLALSGASDDNLTGHIDIRDFWVVDEPRLGSLVAASAEGSGPDGQVDTSRVHFERGSALLSKGPKRLSIRNGVLRGPVIGSTFQGTLYDPNDNIAITGTFMPLYGINRIFGEIPILGQILGNGRDRGLIGITYRLSGKFSDPTLDVNPISAIAPGILRQIFEFR